MQRRPKKVHKSCKAIAPADRCAGVPRCQQQHCAGAPAFNMMPSCSAALLPTTSSVTEHRESCRRGESQRSEKHVPIP